MNSTYLEKIIIRWYGPLSFNGEATLKSGINLILGKNGSGKTRTLQVIENASRNHQAYSPNSSEEEINSIANDQLVYISMWENGNSQSVTFPKNGTWQNHDRLARRVHFISSDRMVRGQLTTANPFKQISDFKIPEPTNEINIVDEFNKAIITELLNRIKKLGEELPALTQGIEKHYESGLVDFEKKIKIDFDRDTPAFFIDHKNREVQLTDLSSGEKEYLYFLAFLYRIRDQEGKVILIDEPELHLHGSQIRKLCEMIKELSEKNQIIIATHSGDILHRFFREANLILLSGGEIKNIEVSEEMEQVVDQLGLPIDPSFFTAHWICAENNPDSHLSGSAAPTTPEVLGWIFGKDIKKRFWSFGSQKGKADARVEILQTLNKDIEPIRLSAILDGDRLIASDQEYPPTLPGVSKGLFYFPCWELENIFLLPDLVNAIILSDGTKSGTDQLWEKIELEKERLLASILKTVVKNISLSKSRYDSLPTTITEFNKWKLKIASDTINEDVIRSQFNSFLLNRKWQWMPGKEVLPILLSLQNSFWLSVKKLVESGKFTEILHNDAEIKKLIYSINQE